MEYYLVQNNYGRNKRMVHKKGCRYLKNTRETYLLNLGSHDSIQSAVSGLENRNFEIAYCKRCCASKVLALEDILVYNCF